MHDACEGMSEAAPARVRRPAQAGFTAAEVVAALAVVTISLIAVLSSLSFGATGIDGARRTTTAVFLAEQRLEQVKAFAMSKNPAQGWANVSAASFPAEAYGAIPGYPGYRRTVVVTNSPGGAANTKQVEVFVFYRPTTPQGLGAETSVALSTLLVSR